MGHGHGVTHYRFNQVDAVMREVGSLVRTYPTAFIDIPEALQVICVYNYDDCDLVY